MEPRAAWGAVVVLGAVLAAGAWPPAGGGLPEAGCADRERLELRGSPDDGGAFGPPWLVCRGALEAALARLGCPGAPAPAGAAATIDEGCRLRRVASSAPVALLLGRRVDVNESGAEDLEALPGIGPGLARRIVASRERYGPFVALRDLRRVQGMGPSRIRALEGWAMAGPEHAR